MKCPTCGYDNLSLQALQCPICGRMLQHSPEPPTSPAARSQESSGAAPVPIVTTSLQTYGTSPQAKMLDRLPSLNNPTFGREQQLAGIAAGCQHRQVGGNTEIDECGSDLG